MSILNGFFKSKYACHIPDMKALIRSGLSDREIARRLVKANSNASELSLQKYVGTLRKLSDRDLEQYGDNKITTDKKEGTVHWRDFIEPVKEMQKLITKAKGSQERANWRIDTDESICVVVLGDTQLGSWGTDYDMFVQITDEIINTPNLYVILVGDLLQMAIKLRGVLEAHDNAIPVEQQIQFLDSWLNDIKHKVIASTWDNHSVIREENAVGFSSYANIFKRHTIYANGICHLDLHVGSQVYKWAVSHFFRGKSILNKTHAPARYMRHEANDREITAQGDYHEPGFSWYREGGIERIAIVCGSIQVNSGYAKRFFSLTTSPVFPCVELFPKEKIMIPYKSVSHWLAAKGLKNEQG